MDTTRLNCFAPFTGGKYLGVCPGSVRARLGSKIHSIYRKKLKLPSFECQVNRRHHISTSITYAAFAILAIEWKSLLQ